MVTARGRRTGAAGVAVLAAAVLVAGAVALANGRRDTAAPGAVASTAPAGGPGATDTDTAPAVVSGVDPSPDGTVVFARSGADLPGERILGRCRTDDRASVAAYDTAALGRVVLQCGTSSQGYAHIRIRHTRDWADELRGHGDRDWDDLMLTAVRTAVSAPRPGFPVDAGDGKVCYAAPIRFDDGSAPVDPYVTVIVSATTDRVITAYPTSRSDC